MQPMYPVVTAKSEGLPGNDSKHDRPGLNRGGGPAFRNRKKIAPKSKGGFGQHGQRVYQHAPMGGGRSSSGNPASRGSDPVHVRPDTRNPNRGGGVQQRGNVPLVQRGGFSHHGQQGVPGGGSHSRPPLKRGNVAGRSARLIAGRFNRKAQGASSSTGMGGKFGSAPVRLDS